MVAVWRPFFVIAQEKQTWPHGKENEGEAEFTFNKELWSKERLEKSKWNDGEKKMIEQIDSTLFVSMYFNGKRHSSFPIKEVTTKFMILHGIPNQPLEWIAYRKEEILYTTMAIINC